MMRLNWGTKVHIAINILKFRFAGIKTGKKLRVQEFVGLYVEGNLIIGDNFRCTSGDMSNAMARNVRAYFKVAPDAVLKIGDNVGISSATLWCANSISIGNNVKIGALCIITDTDAHSLDPQLRANITTDSINAQTAPIFIEDNAFIGTSCIICKGVTIGRNAIVGAGSVVTRNIPDNEIWAGNPAKFIRRL